MFSNRRLLWMATAACEASEPASCSCRGLNGWTVRSISSIEAKRRAKSGLQLMSWSAPIVSPCGVCIGTTSIDFVR